MRVVTIEEALLKGRIQLFWIPLGTILFFLITAIATSINYTKGNPEIPIVIGISGILIACLWWSMKVVGWKIWAFSSVKDAKTLEQRAISRQLIWPQGSWWEKTEIKTREQKIILQKLYEKMNITEAKKEIITDNSLPEEMIFKYPIINVFLPLVILTPGVYLLFTDKYILGIIGVLIGIYGFFDSYKKFRKSQFLFKLNSKGILLPENFYPWQQIEEYEIERTGYGRDATYHMIFYGGGFYEKISLQDLNINAFKIERYLDVYRSRFELKQRKFL